MAIICQNCIMLGKNGNFCIQVFGVLEIMAMFHLGSSMLQTKNINLYFLGWV